MCYYFNTFHEDYSRQTEKAGSEKKMKNSKEFTNALLVGDVNALGYGTVPKMVMIDKRLSGEAKLIYCYLCSHTGVSNAIRFNHFEICEDLGIELPLYYRSLTLLLTYGYVELIDDGTDDEHSAIFVLNSHIK